MNDAIKKIKLEKNNETPLYRQLADGIFSLMENRLVKMDERLPSVRELAAALGINNGTAAAAYRVLEEKNVLRTVHGRGSFCAFTGREDGFAPIVKRKCPYLAPNTVIKADFTKTSVSDTLFPVEKFRDIFNMVLERDKGQAFSYQPSVGYEPLRRSLARLLAEKGIKTSADRIQIISGSQQGIDLVARAFVRSGNAVYCEQFTYLGAANSMLAQNAEIFSVPLSGDGIDISALEKMIKERTPRLVYVMPRFQTPTGISYSLECKRALLNLAYKHDFYIIEEDNLSDFDYSGEAAAPLKALDYKNKVIYIKSFSKILMPGLRLGYMVLPKAVSEKIADLKASTDISTSGFTQRAFDMFLQTKGWERHKSDIAALFKNKCSLAYSLAKKHLSEFFEISEPKGGLTLWLKVKQPYDTESLCRAFAEEGIAVISGGFYTLAPENVPYIALSFADIDDESMKTGFECMEKVCGRITAHSNIVKDIKKCPLL